MRLTRRALGIVFVSLLALIGGLAAGGTSTSPAATSLLSCPASVRGLGRIAVAVRGGLELIDLRTCRVASYRAGAVAEVRFSANGRWLGYSVAAGRPRVMPAAGGLATRPLPTGVTSWFWGGSGATLFGVGTQGELVTAAPTGHPAIVARGVGEVVPSPGGGLAASSVESCITAPQGQLSVIALATGRQRPIFSERIGQPRPAAFSPDGNWLLYWAGEMCSSSLAADGWPLEAISTAGAGHPVTAIGHMLLFPDFLTWCGGRLIAAAGPSRETQLGSRLMATAPPAWRARTIESARRLSWVSPSCAPSGHTLAAAAGPDMQNAQFGVEDRSIWLLRPTGTIVGRLTDPPAGESDESPRFARDGRWILFVRTRVITRGLSAYSQDTLELVRASASHAGQPVPLLEFTSDDVSFYDHFDWPGEIDWSAGAQFGLR